MYSFSFAIAFSTRLSQIGTLIATCLVFFIGMMSDAWFGKPLYEIEQHWLDRAVNAGQVETVDRVRIMQKSNGDIEEVITETVQALPGTSLSEFATSSELAKWTSYKVAYSVVPNFQVLWLTDALTQENVIPNSYLLKISGYGVLYMVSAISLGIILFQRREVS